MLGRRVVLVFPPSWTLTTGSAHLALPLLQGWLRSRGVETLALDLNIRAAALFGCHLDAATAATAADAGTLEDMNAPYFEAEDRLNEIAKGYAGTWNIQTGFAFDDQPQQSTQRLFEAIRRPSPFSAVLESAVREIEGANPDVVGISVASEFQLVHAFTLAQLIKASGSRAAVILGGNIITRLFEPLSSAVRTFDFVDGLVPYGGEGALEALAAIKGDSDRFGEVPDLVWREGGVVRTNARGPVFAPDSAVAPSHEGLASPYWGVSYSTMVSERGCYYGKCSFCAIPFGWGPDGYAGRRGVDATAMDLRSVANETGTARFKFVDEAIRPSLVASLTAALTGDRFEWEAYARLEKAFEHRALIHNAARAGLRKLYFGLEVAPSANRDKLGKGDHGDVADILAVCADSGVKVHLFCMLGYPGTSEADARDTVDFVLANDRWIDTADVVGWGYARHTNVSGVQLLPDHDDDLALERDWIPNAPSVLAQDEVDTLTGECLDQVWNASPKLLHPTYRLVSPWSR